CARLAYWGDPLDSW
nr:immunoglobulin heavy chain junction region [Macaca mulatta]MOV48839.1 immunoglobulin heavy chain junction region [Macaca mulatta]MOV49187.1 immunoglobulin heavy chain junction region [Macaca mulatta]MOV49298.1 immunoglobulin heavy chain junction region [Macaca mulatta]MOV49363.1 immunoglobulin heavy chain junction region [Macaca mulatta]